MSDGLKAPDLLHIPHTFDTVIQKEALRELAESRYPLVDLARLDRRRTVVDKLYHEAADKRFKDPLRIRALVLHEPQKKDLNKYGLDQSRKLMVHVTTLHLDDLGILENRDDFLIGDLIMWGGETYEIKDQEKDTESYWMNTNIPFYLVLGCDIYRRGT